jgi:NADH-quinone oxidoreductase subunit J
MLDLIIGFFIFFSSILTIAAANSIYGALQLIVTYCLVSILLLIYDIEFFAITYIIVCAGGMGVLFLFVVMTLSIIQLPQKKAQYFTRWRWFSIFAQFVLFIIPMLVFLWTQFVMFNEFDLTYLQNSRLNNYTYNELYGTNIIEIGSFLYLKFPLIVILGGIILFFALIAAVFLTVEHTKTPRWNAWLFSKIN